MLRVLETFSCYILAAFMSLFWDAEKVDRIVQETLNNHTEV